MSCFVIWAVGTDQQDSFSETGDDLLQEDYGSE